MLLFERSQKKLGCTPGAKGMGTGWTYTYLKDIKYGNGFVWQRALHFEANVRQKLPVVSFLT
jgi:hypothetical protein